MDKPGHYKFIDNITSDVVFEAYGKDLKELFENAAEALFHMICKFDRIDAKDGHQVELTAESAEDLMKLWLQKLISDVDIEEMFFREFNITEIDDTHLKATIKGEPVTPEKGETVVKAITYHQWEFKKTPDGYMCRVSLDI
ncbi:archease [Candidatus Woesearchaeota archaeon]|nr:archease [Candidatus Woesearchaeota archaeon]